MDDRTSLEHGHWTVEHDGEVARFEQRGDMTRYLGEVLKVPDRYFMGVGVGEYRNVRWSWVGQLPAYVQFDAEGNIEYVPANRPYAPNSPELSERDWRDIETCIADALYLWRTHGGSGAGPESTNYQRVEALWLRLFGVGGGSDSPQAMDTRRGSVVPILADVDQQRAERAGRVASDDRG